jgi:hypothetical protein
MKKFLPLAFILLSIHATAQIRSVSVELSANYPLINRSKQTSTSTLTIPTTSGYSYLTTSQTVKETYDGRPGVDLNIGLDVGISRKFFITTGVSGSYIRYKRNVDIWIATNTSQMVSSQPVTITGTPLGSYYGYSNPQGENGIVLGVDRPFVPTNSEDSDKFGETTALYLEIPALAGTTVMNGKLDIRAGFVGSWLLQATEYRTKVFPEDYSYTIYREKNPGNLNSILAGGIVQTTYKLSPHLGIDLTARRYFRSIYKEQGNLESEARYTMLSLGLRYMFNLVP